MSGGCNAGDCTNPQSLTFDGGAGVPVGVQGPFNFSGWIYDSGASSPPTYPQAILDQSSSTQVTCSISSLVSHECTILRCVTTGLTKQAVDRRDRSGLLLRSGYRRNRIRRDSSLRRCCFWNKCSHYCNLHGLHLDGHQRQHHCKPARISELQQCHFWEHLAAAALHKHCHHRQELRLLQAVAWALHALTQQ